MIVLLDANVLLRLADPTSVTHTIAATAVVRLRAQGNKLCIVPQCIYEFWAVATRPIANNGLALSPAECLREVANLKTSFPLLSDKPAMYTEWETIVAVFACQGKVTHDARYVAAMRTHGTTDLLTFNVGDFARFTWINVLDPNMVATSGPPSKSP